MRLISQNGSIDVPYDKVILGICDQNNKQEYVIYAYHDSPRPLFLATYSTTDKALKAMEMLRTAYTGRFVTTANVPDDFNEQLKELMKGGFGTVIVKDTNDSRVEFNNLNGYFKFPQDEDVEV